MRAGLQFASTNESKPMSNAMFAVWIGLSAGILLLFLYAAFLNLRRRQSPGAELGDLITSFLPVDVEVLSDIIDPAQQRLLQETYGQEELLRIYRQQVSLAKECLLRMSHNAGVHVRLYTFMALIVLQVRTSLQWLPLFSAANTGDVRSIVASSLLPAYA